MSLSPSEQICFIGAGSMAEAIIRGLIEQKTALPSQICVVNRQNRDRLAELHDRYGIAAPQAEEDKLNAVQQADVIVLAMKPKDASAAIRDIGKLFKEKQLIVSVIAGLSIRTIANLMEAKPPIVRTMPNTSSTIGEGVTGISFSAHVTEEQRQTALSIFNSIGITATVEEHQLDLITGVSGSGPAYIYYMMEAMIEAAVEGGLSEETAKRLVTQTVLGAAQMVKTTGEDPAVLREKVTSPNGTTEAALKLMAENGFPRIVNQAVKRAALRAAEIGKSLEQG